MGFCREHDVAEALCWICTPALEAAYRAKNDWCGGHGLPESRCTLCNHGPAPAAVAAEHPAPSKTAGEGRAGADPNPADVRSPAPTSAGSRTHAPPRENCAINRSRVKLAAESAARAGLTTAAVERRAFSEALICNAVVAYDGNRLIHIGPRVSGVVRTVGKDIGDAVQAGDVLAELDSPELAAAKAEYRQAGALESLHETNYQRYKSLSERGLATALEVQEAETRVAESRISRSAASQRLFALGVTGDQISALDQDGVANPLLAIVAPFDGVVVERSAVVGEWVRVEDTLFSVADTRRMWAMVDTTDPAARLQVGQPVELEIDGLEGRRFLGELTWVSSAVDPATRTIRARAEFENIEGYLRANLFGRASVVTHDETPHIVIPKAAVQWDGCCNLVFVLAGADEYHARPIRIGDAHEQYFEVREGLTPGETVVVAGSFLLKTEIMKSEIGAGCCEAK